MRPEGFLSSNSSKPIINAGSGIKKRIALVTFSTYWVTCPFVVMPKLISLSQFNCFSVPVTRNGIINGTYLLKIGFSS